MRSIARRTVRGIVVAFAAGLSACGGGSGGGGGVAAMFGGSTQFSVGAGTHPSGVVMADFNLDGKMDLAVANRTDDSVTVFLGAGGGLFGAGSTFSVGVGGQPSALVAADFNADGKLDLAVANSAGDDVVVLSGTGTGAFALTATVLLGVGADASGIVAADLNGDGRLDLAVTDRATGNVSVALATGPGTFGTATTFLVGAGFEGGTIASADFNDDGRLDLAVASEANGSVAILLGTGTGSFGTASTFAVDAGANLSSVVAADWNGDGRVDLAVTNRTTGQASVLLGNGDGTFGGAINAGVGVEASAAAVGDFDRDGRLDLAVTVEATGDVDLLLGHGDGTFGAAMVFGTGGSASAALAVGDMDGNGSLDIAVANSASASVAILLGSSHATGLSFTSGASVALGASFDSKSVVTADFNGDGRLDIAVANAGDDSISIALGTGTGTFGAAVQTSLGLGMGPSAVAAGDVNGDGKIDLVVTNRTGSAASILLGSGTGTFALTGSIALTLGAQPSSLVVADFNEDGKADVVVTNNLLGNVSIALGAGGGTFGAATSFAISLGFQGGTMTAADFNHDGHLDLAVASEANGTVAILLGNGTGSFGAATTVTADAGATLTGIATADLNGDGNLDIVVSDETSGIVSVMLGTGTGTFGAATAFAVGADAGAVVVGDFNRDGKLDLAVTLAATGRVEILLGNGSGGFGAATDFAAGGTGSVSVSTCDLNDDGRLDLVVANRTTGNVGVLLGS